MGRPGHLGIKDPKTLYSVGASPERQCGNPPQNFRRISCFDQIRIGSFKSNFSLQNRVWDFQIRIFRPAPPNHGGRRRPSLGSGAYGRLREVTYGRLRRPPPQDVFVFWGTGHRVQKQEGRCALTEISIPLRPVIRRSPVHLS